MNPHKRTIYCKHFNGSTDEKPCALGIDIATLPRLNNYPPCIWGSRHEKACDGCDKREFPTEEEIAEEKRRSEESVLKVLTARAAIVEESGGKRGVTGRLDCPVCKRGSISYSVAAGNGHIWACCNTPECVSWLE